MNRSYSYNDEKYRFQVSLSTNIKVKMYSYADEQILLHSGQFGFDQIPPQITQSYHDLSQFYALFSEEKNLQIFPTSGKFALTLKDQSKYLFALEQSQTYYSKIKCQLVFQKELLYQQNLLKETQKLQNQFQSMKERNNLYQTIIAQKQQELQWTIPSSTNVTELTEPFSKIFQINQSTITYVGKDYQWRQILMKRQISHQHIDQFSCKIIKTKGRRLFIGITDYLKQKSQNYSHHSGNAVCYWGYNGRIWYGKVGEGEYKDQGDGFNEGQKITVQTDLKKGIMRWIVDGMTRASIECQMLKDRSRKYVPFADFYNHNDSIQWSQ